MVAFKENDPGIIIITAIRTLAIHHNLRKCWHSPEVGLKSSITDTIGDSAAIESDSIDIEAETATDER